MTHQDIIYFLMCYEKGWVKSPFLEIGSLKVNGGTNLCDLVRERGGQAVGCDLQAGDGVDIVQDFAISSNDFVNRWLSGYFATVAVFNVLEHVFDPITVLRNALHCVAGGGTLLVVVPVVWPLHYYPRDYCRLMPDWFREFARRTGITLIPEGFCWLSQFGVIPIDTVEDIPTFITVGREHNPMRYFVSRVVHRLFNTYGRSHWFCNTAIGACFLKQEVAS